MTDYDALLKGIDAVIPGAACLNEGIGHYLIEAARAIRELRAEIGFTDGLLENANLKWAALESKLAEATALLQEVEALRDVLHNVQHGNICPAQPGWLDAGPCTCGLDEALRQA